MEGAYEHPSSSLGHSEELSVENPVGPPVPEFAQATEERPKILASMTGEESRYVLEEDGGRSVALHKVEEGEGEAAALSGEATPFAGNAEVLTGEAAGPEGGVSPINGTLFPLRPADSVRGGTEPPSSASGYPCIPGPKLQDVTEVRDSWPSLGEDVTGVGVDLGEADGPPSGTLKPKVKSSDS